MLYEWFSMTRTMGIIAYTVAFVACMLRSLAWARGRLDGNAGRIFALLGMMQLALLLDKVFNWRWLLHEHWMRTAMVEGVYDRRRPFQVVVLALLTVGLVAVAVWIVRRFRHRAGLATAMTGTILSIGIWCCEAISFHYFDLVLFYKLGHAMVVSFLWAGCALLTTIGAVRGSRSFRVG